MGVLRDLYFHLRIKTSMYQLNNYAYGTKKQRNHIKKTYEISKIKKLNFNHLNTTIVWI